MDQDDPEKRIAELERQLADQKRVGPGANQWSQQGAFSPPPTGRSALTTGGFLTPEQVRNVAFSQPPIGKRGYNEDEVDTFLDLVEAALQDPSGRTLTPEQVRNMAFTKPPIGKRGYNEDEVDAFLDLVEEQMKSQRGAFSPPPRAAFPPPPTGRLPARHTAGSQTRVGIIDAVIDIFGRIIGAVLTSSWVWWLLGVAFLAGLLAGLRLLIHRVLPHFIPGLASPAPPVVGLLFLAVPAVVVLVYLVKRFGRRR